MPKDKKLKTGPKLGPLGKKISLGNYMAEGAIPMLKYLAARDRMGMNEWLEMIVVREYQAATRGVLDTSAPLGDGLIVESVPECLPSEQAPGTHSGN